MKTENKTVLVTGGSRGIGKGIVRLMAESGYRTAFTYKINRKPSEEFVTQLREKGLEVLTLAMDQADHESISECIRQVKASFNAPVSILINNAAIAQEKPFETISDRDWELMIRTNLQGPFMLMQEIIPQMVENRFGRIVNITSIGGQWGGYNQVHYAASKAALINLTQSVARIYSSSDITCNAVAIGLAKTDMSGPELETPEGRKKVSGIPAGRVGTIEEIANTVKFLCSREASYITGQTINVNGGMYFG